MGLLDAIKSALGIGKTSTEQAGETTVSVEHEPASEATDDRAGGEADEEDGEEDGEEVGEETDEATGETEEVDEPVAEPTDATGSTESILDKEGAASDPAEAAEPAEAAGPESEDMTTDIDETGPDPGSATSTESESTVQEIKGIGPAYGERLAEAGVETVGDLADADAEALAEQTGVSDSRIREWIDRAREFEE